jgi:hypothetical protein
VELTRTESRHKYGTEAHLKKNVSDSGIDTNSPGKNELNRTINAAILKMKYIRVKIYL